MTPSLSLLLLSAALALPATPASALCVSRPDNAASGYVENNTAQTLCLQRELSQRAQQLQLEGRLQALQAEMAAEMRRQRLLATPVPEVRLPQPAW